MTPLIKYPILQHAWFVSDIDAACEKWHRTTGAGPFFVSQSITLGGTQYGEQLRGYEEFSVTPLGFLSSTGTDS